MSLFKRRGIEILDNFRSLADCGRLIASIHDYAAFHDLPLIERAERERSLRYYVIDGEAVEAGFPELLRLYADVLALVRRQDERLVPLANRRARINVNLTPRGGEYRWHYDRNAMTAILFLNSVTGGEIEMYPDLRIHLGRFKDAGIQRMLDRVVRWSSCFVQAMVVAPEPGRMILMRGDRCLHSVRSVTDGPARISVILSFDLPGARFRAQDDLDAYLYSREKATQQDPNYRRDWL